MNKKREIATKNSEILKTENIVYMWLKKHLPNYYWYSLDEMLVIKKDVKIADEQMAIFHKKDVLKRMG